MNPFEQMAAVLAKREPPRRQACAPRVTSTSRTGAIRDLLKAEGRPMSAAEIAYDVDLPSFNQNLVWLLLKYDIAKERVIYLDGKFEWSTEYDSEHNVQIRAAIKLLEKSGYSVTRQEGGGI